MLSELFYFLHFIFLIGHELYALFKKFVTHITYFFPSIAYTLAKVFIICPSNPSYVYLSELWDLNRISLSSLFTLLAETWYSSLLGKKKVTNS